MTATSRPFTWIPDRIQRSIDEILSVHGDTVLVKPKSLIKFGRNDDIGTTQEMVWIQGGIETLVTSGNLIDTVSSSNAGDSQEVKIEGHTISGSNLTFTVQTATLNGQNKVTLSTPLYRSTRIFNNDNTDLSGTVYVYEDDTITGGVPDTAAKIHLRTDGSNNQSLKCATSLSSQDYWILTGGLFSVNRQNTRNVDFKVQNKEFGKVFRTFFPISVGSSTGSVYVPFDPCYIIPKNSDVRVLATSSGVSTGVEAVLYGYLALVQ